MHRASNPLNEADEGQLLALRFGEEGAYGEVGVVLAAFALATAGGVLLGKLMSRLPGSPVNPLIGAAGVSAVPMAARVAGLLFAVAAAGFTHKTDFYHTLRATLIHRAETDFLNPYLTLGELRRELAGGRAVPVMAVASALATAKVAAGPSAVRNAHSSSGRRRKCSTRGRACRHFRSKAPEMFRGRHGETAYH